MNKKNKRIYIRVTENQYNLIKENAKNNNMTISQYILFKTDTSNNFLKKDILLLTFEYILLNLNDVSTSKETDSNKIKEQISNIIKDTITFIKTLNKI